MMAAAEIEAETKAATVLAPDEHAYQGLLPGEGYTVTMSAVRNEKGRAECVELIKQLYDAPRTTFWKEGRKLESHVATIPPGTAIATFVKGQYPNHRPRGQKHAAIFVRATEAGIYVLDQFVRQLEVRERFIPWSHPRDRRAVNNASSYSTIRW